MCGIYAAYFFSISVFGIIFYGITTDFLAHNLTVQRQAPACLSRILADHFNSQKRTFAAKGHLYFALFLYLLHDKRNIIVPRPS